MPSDGIRAKLNRAEEHLNVLDGLIGSYFAEEPYRIAFEEWTEGDYWNYAVYLHVAAFPPDEIWGPIIGDAVHNLRSALDHLAWNLATDQARAETPRRIEFPIILDDPDKDAEARGKLKRLLGCLRPETHAVIDGSQPYKTGDSHHPLWLLQALWNTDKHRTLHTTGFAYILAANLSESSEYGYNGWAWGPFGDRFDSENRTPLGGGRTFIPALASAKPLQHVMDTYEGVTFDVILGHTRRTISPDEPYGGLPIRQVLRRLQRYVIEDVVKPLS